MEPVTLAPPAEKPPVKITAVYIETESGKAVDTLSLPRIPEMPREPLLELQILCDILGQADFRFRTPDSDWTSANNDAFFQALIRLFQAFPTVAADHAPELVERWTERMIEAVRSAPAPWPARDAATDHDLGSEHPRLDLLYREIDAFRPAATAILDREPTTTGQAMQAKLLEDATALLTVWTHGTDRVPGLESFFNPSVCIRGVKLALNAEYDPASWRSWRWQMIALAVQLARLAGDEAARQRFTRILGDEIACYAEVGCGDADPYAQIVSLLRTEHGLPPI